MDPGGQASPAEGGLVARSEGRVLVRFFDHRADGLDASGTEILDAFQVLGRPALHDAEGLDQIPEPVGKPIGELKLQDDPAGQVVDRMHQGGGDLLGQVLFGLDLAVEGHSLGIIVAHVGLPQVGDMHLRLGVQIVLEMAEALQGDELLGVLREQMLLGGEMARQQPGDRFLPDPTPLLQDAVVHAPLDLEEDGRGRIDVVVAQAELEAVLVPVDGPPVGLQVVRIQVQAMHRIGKVGLAHTVLIQSDVAADKFPHAESHLRGEEILQLKPRLLHPILCHSSMRNLCSVPGRVQEILPGRREAAHRERTARVQSSGSGWPLVSGAQIKATIPRRNTNDKMVAALRKGSAIPWPMSTSLTFMSSIGKTAARYRTVL